MVVAGSAAVLLRTHIAGFLGLAEAEACAPEGEAFANFVAHPRPKAVQDAAFVDGEGRERRLSEFAGEGLVVNFWATWCAPCVREMPDLDRLAAALEGQPIRVLPVSLDREGRPVVDEFYAVNGITRLPAAFDPGRRLMRALAVGGLPTTVLIDAEGRERVRVEGIAEWSSPEHVAYVRRCLAPDGAADDA
ncbi:MAG: TlpA family protein disulfide reductase [Alphaproteobacteria bacterium]|nr:TlpA family protein disulfide reductase [Alphaproteobacteria bacterium]